MSVVRLRLQIPSRTLPEIGSDLGTEPIPRHNTGGWATPTSIGRDFIICCI